MVKIQKSHSITWEKVLSPTTRKPRAHPTPRMGTSTREAWKRVLCGKRRKELKRDRGYHWQGREGGRGQRSRSNGLPKQACVPFFLPGCSDNDIGDNYQDHYIHLHYFIRYISHMVHTLCQYACTYCKDSYNRSMKSPVSAIPFSDPAAGKKKEFIVGG